jgi:organic radical activating enzyme
MQSDPTLLELGDIYLNAGCLDQAFEVLVRALENAPEDPSVLLQMARLALQAKMPEDAGNFLSGAISGSADGRQKAYALHADLVRGGRVEDAAIVWGLLQADAAATVRDPRGELLERYESYRRQAGPMIEDGRQGRLVLRPDVLWLRISGICNLRCVGCYVEGKFEKRFASLAEVRQAIRCDQPVRQISFTANEALLHPRFDEIIRLCREAHPEAMVWVISNGTLPVTGSRRRAISMLDKVGLSIDGATKETYESIRKGAVFERFLKNARDIVALREETGYPKEIGFAFTATATNLHELSGVVRLAKEIGATDVWAQPMESTDEVIDSRISEILLENMTAERRTALIDEARAEAARVGIPFYFQQGLYPDDGSNDDLHMRLCQYPWGQPAQIEPLSEGYAVLPCCYISVNRRELLAEKYGMRHQTQPEMEQVYNSPGFWQFRDDLLEGRTGDVCGKGDGGCHAAQGFPWRPSSGISG